MFNSLMPSLNIRSLPFVVFMGGFPSRLQNLSSGAIRPGGLLFNNGIQGTATWSQLFFVPLKWAKKGCGLINDKSMRVSNKYEGVQLWTEALLHLKCVH